MRASLGGQARPARVFPLHIALSTPLFAGSAPRAAGSARQITVVQSLPVAKRPPEIPRRWRIYWDERRQAVGRPVLSSADARAAPSPAHNFHPSVKGSKGYQGDKL